MRVLQKGGDLGGFGEKRGPGSEVVKDEVIGGGAGRY